MAVLHPKLRKFVGFGYARVFNKDCKHMDDTSVRNCIIIPQENSHKGMGGPRRSACCNVQDLFDFWIWLCKGLAQ